MRVGGSFIIGTGMYAPDSVMENERIAAQLGLQPEQIFKSSGIRRRRWASKGTTTSALGCAALQAACAGAAIEPANIDYLLFGTTTPDRYIPGSGFAVQHALGMAEIPVLDIRAACCNALYGLQLAALLVESGQARNVAVCLAEVHSAWLDLSPASGTISMLFGDGAAAFIVSANPKPGALEIVDVLLAANGAYVDDLGIRSPGTEFGTAGLHSESADSKPRMAGQSVILHASRKMKAACETVLNRNGKTVDDVRWIVPHQANQNLLMQLSNSLHLPSTSEVISIVDEYGNTGSAALGMALDTLCRSGRVSPGDYLLMPAFAAGFTWGAALCRVPAP